MKYSELLKQVEMPTFMQAVRLLWQDRSAVWKDTKNALVDLASAVAWIIMLLFVWAFWPTIFAWRVSRLATRRFVTWAKTMYTLWRLGD